MGLPWTAAGPFHFYMKKCAIDTVACEKIIFSQAVSL
jgi:hypothetical protein